jgi:transcriptional regulator with XRE-family HTH domain
MTQVELAEKTGIAQFHISAIETGRIEDIKTDTLWRLAKALGVTTDSLLAREEAPAPAQHRRRKAAPVG